MQSKTYKVSFFVVLFIGLNYAYRIYDLKTWKSDGGVINNDMISYYGYLPAFFIYQDMSLSFKDEPGFLYHDKVWGLEMPNKRNLIRMSMGLSFMYAPFFISAHGYLFVKGGDRSGYSDNYEIALLMSSLFYSILGLVFLRKLLKLFFNDYLTALVILIIGMGTNLYNYATVEACMSHAYLFCLINVFILAVIKWYQNPVLKWSVLIGLLIGLISLIRPTHILIFLFFFLYKIVNWVGIKERLVFYFKYKYQLVLLFICCFCIWIPQLSYWKYVTGNWLFFSYVGSTFYFLKPHIIDGLFSFRKGWLLYTPLMCLSIAGFIVMRKRIPDLFFATLVFFLLSLYVIFSWWCWWYGGSFGQRPMIDLYGLLAIPMGCFLAWIFEKGPLSRIITTLVVFGLISIQLFQSYQYYWGSIHWDAMTREAYMASFLRKNPPPGWYYLLKVPDYEGARIYGIEKSAP